MGIPIRKITESSKIQESLKFSELVERNFFPNNKLTKSAQVGDLVKYKNKTYKVTKLSGHSDTVTLEDEAGNTLDAKYSNLGKTYVKDSGRIKSEFRSQFYSPETKRVKESQQINEALEENSSMQAYADIDARRVFMFPSYMSNDEVEEAIAEFLMEEDGLTEDEAKADAKEITDKFFDVFEWE